MAERKPLSAGDFEAERIDLMRRHFKIGCLLISSVSLLSTYAFIHALSEAIRPSLIAANATIVAISFLGFLLSHSMRSSVPLLVFSVLASCSTLQTVVILLTGGVRSPHFSVLLIYILGTSFLAASKTMYAALAFGAICTFYTVTMVLFDRDIDYELLSFNVVALILSSLMGHTGTSTRLNLHLKEFRTRFMHYRERESVCRSLHDSLSADLFNILLQIDAIKHIQADDESITRRLLDIQKASRRGIENIRDFLFSADRSSTTIDALVERMEDYGYSLFGNYDMEFNVSRKIPDNAPPLPTLHTFNLFLIFKEAITNIAKHARAETVYVSIVHDLVRLTMEIKDDGVGFNSYATQFNRYGIRNMKTRVEELEGTLHITARPGSGVRLMVSVPFSQ